LAEVTLVESDADLASLRSDPRWPQTVGTVRATAGAWMANNATATPEHPADLGYYVGYKIAEAFHARAQDKRRAPAEMIEVTDFDAFLARSGYPDGMRASPGH